MRLEIRCISRPSVLSTHNAGLLVTHIRPSQLNTTPACILGFQSQFWTRPSITFLQFVFPVELYFAWTTIFAVYRKRAHAREWPIFKMRYSPHMVLMQAASARSSSFVHRRGSMEIIVCSTYGSGFLAENLLQRRSWSLMRERDRYFTCSHNTGWLSSFLMKYGDFNWFKLHVFLLLWRQNRFSEDAFLEDDKLCPFLKLRSTKKKDPME